MTQEPTKAPFITFYSFKGGVGRSMALINTAAILAGRGFRVLVLDLDLEAPGLSYLACNTADAAEAAPPGFVDLLSDARARGTQADLFAASMEAIAKKYTRPYILPGGKDGGNQGRLHIMAAGKLDKGYTKRFDDLNLRQLYEDGVGKPLISVFKQRIAESELYDYVLIDSRTGFSDEAGICTRDLADYLMILSGLNRQNVEGTAEFLKALDFSTGGKAKFQLILSPVPTGEDALLEAREAAAQERFSAACGRQVDLSLQIPYHPRLALTEEPHVLSKRKGPLVQAYQAIEREMLRALGHDAPKLEQEIIKALKAKEFDLALAKLNRRLRLDEAQQAVHGIVVQLALGADRTERKSAQEPIAEEIRLDDLLAQDAGRKILKILVEHVPCGENDLVGKVFVRQLRDKDDALADRLYQRLADANPNDANVLGNYASFLAYQRGDMDGAQEKYEQAIAADPRHASSLGNYANFLLHQRGDMDGAQEKYERAIAADPKHANILGNYGQFLLGQGKFSESRQMLQSALAAVARSSTPELAEFSYSLWLVTRIENQDATIWAQGFKSYLQLGFKRFPWSFERMLSQAEKHLGADEMIYARALAAAFLDESKVADLGQFAQWLALGNT